MGQLLPTLDQSALLNLILLLLMLLVITDQSQSAYRSTPNSPHTDLVFLMTPPVDIVGYDKGQNLYHLRNSWGTSWGESGYMRIAMGKNTCGMLTRSVYPQI